MICGMAVLRCSINTLFWGNQMNKITVRCGEWFSIGSSSTCESASREPWEIQLYWSRNKSNSESCWLESVAIVYQSLVQVPCQMDPYMNGFVIQNMSNSHWFYVIIIFIHFSQRIEVAKNIHKYHKLGEQIMLTVCTFISGSLFEFRVLFAKGFAAQPAASWPDLSWGANSISVATKQISYVYIIYVYTHVIINDNNLF